MQLAIIVAIANNRVIGNQNQLPWRLPADLKYFKQVTLGKTVIMGRKTYESIGKPLPERQNIIITRQSNFHAEGCLIAHSLKEAISMADQKKEVYIIGGAEIFQQALPLVDRIYLTMIHHDFVGDTYFPEWKASEWNTVSQTDCEPDERNLYHYSFITLERTQGTLKR